MPINTPSKSLEIITSGRNTLQLEAQALINASNYLGSEFVNAVNVISSRSGKVVVTGLGKSGHIARKIAATLASTGTASFFLHPSEALHGDMGMLQSDDTLLAIAFGGETFEVNEVAKYARRMKMPVIGITGKKSSQLAQLSDIILNGGVEKEACPLGLAPTTSSTLALALGDALAVALMGVKGISTQDFASWHPGGNLGKKLTLVQDMMIPKSSLVHLNPEDNFKKVITAVTQGNLGVAPVIDHSGVLAGCVTDGDLRRALIKFSEQALQKTAQEMMTKNPVQVQPDFLVLDAFNLMESKKITAVFVTDSSTHQLLGLLKIHDLLAAKVI